MTADFRHQVAKAYRAMAVQARYRPAAPSDGLGSITRPLADLDLDSEALDYARAWRAEEDSGTYGIGSPDYTDRPALIFTIEAARVLCGQDHRHAVRLLRMAADDIEARQGGGKR